MPLQRQATNAVAHLRHLARLDATGPELIAPALASLHALIGFDSSGYFYPGAGGELDVHMEHPAVQAAVPDHFDPRILASEARVFHNVLQHGDDIARHPHGPQSLAQMLRVPAAELLRSDYYNVVMRPAGVGDWLSLPLRAPHGQGVGMLFLFRPQGRGPSARRTWSRWRGWSPPWPARCGPAARAAASTARCCAKARSSSPRWASRCGPRPRPSP